MTTENNKPSTLTSILVGVSLAAFFAPLFALTLIYPEAIENTVSDSSIPLSGLLVGFLGMLFARCNLDVARFGELIKPISQRTKQADEKMSWEAKVIFCISVTISLVSLIMTGTTVATMIS